MAKKLTYAEIAEKLTQSYNKYDKQLQNAVTEAEKNSATRMLRRVSERMNGLVLENQEAANQQDMKKQAPNSPNLSIGTRTANGYAYGGITPPEYQGGGQTLPEGVTEKDGVYTFSERVMDGSTYAFFKSLGGLDAVSKGTIVMPEDATTNMQFNGSTYEIDLNTNKPVNVNGQPYVEPDPDADYLDRPLNEDGTLADPPVVNTPSTSGGRLYNNVKAADFEDQMAKARAITGIEDFSATNPEHVKALQTAMLNKSGEASMFSGQEGDILNDGGSRSINNAGVDGKFGIDTLTALRQQGLSTGTPAGIQPFNLPPSAELNMPPIEGIDTPIMLDDVVVTGKKPGDGLKGIGKKLGKALPGALAGLSKMQEYAAHARAISDMQAPAPKNLEDPVYLNTQYNIAPQINAAEEQTALLARGLNANSTKRNNVRNNLAGLAAGNQRTFNQLYADKFNKESQLQNMQTMANAKAKQLNNNIIFDNENALLDFNNQKRDAKARFSSAITADAMNLLTQRTNRNSQEAALEALKPSWNKYGVMDRQYQDNGQNTELLRLLGLI